MTKHHLAHLVFAISLFIGSGTSSRSPWRIAMKIRGGSSNTSSLETIPEIDFQEDDHQTMASSTSSATWPEIRTKDMAMALRYTAEVNRKLQVATTDAAYTNQLHHHRQQQQHMPMEELTVRGGYTNAPSISLDSPPFRIPMHRTNPKETKELLSIFHAPVSMSRNQRGISRWGPSLEKYLYDIKQIFNVSSLEWSLTMLYLDRACTSFEQCADDRSSSAPSLPFCIPRTVHRLVATALLLALSVLREEDRGLFGDNTEKQSLNIQYSWKQQLNRLIRSTNANEEDWESRVQCMRKAIQDDVFVTPDQMDEFKMLWEARFL